MKNITILGFVLMCLILDSCSTENPGRVKEADLVGKWNYETFHSTSNGSVDVPEGPYAGNAAGCSKDFLQLNEDHTVVSGDYHNGSCALQATAGTWLLTGESVTVVLNGHTHYYQVDVTATTLAIRETISMLGFTEKEYYTFSKQN